jgi:hypothetical protein
MGKALGAFSHPDRLRFRDSSRGWRSVESSRSGLGAKRAPSWILPGDIAGSIDADDNAELVGGGDVRIYAQNNTGRTYKLGYTAGVDACGVIFFGYAFWRWSRSLKERN